MQQSNGTFRHSLWGCSSRKLCALALAEIYVQKISLRDWFCGRWKGVWNISPGCALHNTMQQVNFWKVWHCWPCSNCDAHHCERHVISCRMALPDLNLVVIWSVWLTAVINLQLWIWTSCLSTEYCALQHNTSYVGVVVFCTPWDLQYCLLDTWWESFYHSPSILRYSHHQSWWLGTIEKTLVWEYSCVRQTDQKIQKINVHFIFQLAFCQGQGTRKLSDLTSVWSITSLSQVYKTRAVRCSAHLGR